MVEVRVEPATASRFDDVATLLNSRGREQACWCLHWRMPRGLSVDGREGHLRELCAHEPPGLLAYLEDTGGGTGTTPVGWVGLAPRSAAGSLQRSRVLPRGEPEGWPTTWVVMCFVVRVGYRRRGVARALLRGAVDHARSRGARAVEGFPVEVTPGARVPVSAAFVGTVPLFESEGFEQVGETAATSGRLPRWWLRRALD
ncbi:GNAT family N-acetyltransferase [Isoptericola halotolerans]|uniref:GNAT superfamily N-acetyltransferase n=1 Tax=Isoptericola halotolerans TaxID=300560 RepID=A0ABX2A8K9_9MICO|nr:GNAT family N-acetyltransferase [Isoptericola halotolerans]NOV98283.1 GNAT superfamily N-acetyltransferase [Isoptericola halotolerans]